MKRFIVHIVLYLLMKLLSVFYVPAWIVWSLRKPKQCPKVLNEVLLFPAAVLAEKIRHKQVSCTDVVRIYIERAKSVNEILNAIVENRFELALKDAEGVDELIDSNRYSTEELKEKYPLLGVPVTIKEAIAVQDMSNSAGSKLVEKKALHDANAVKFIKESGAIVLLVSNTPELCMNWESFNLVTGVTSNPYDTRRTPGGSSGGEASLLASCGSVIGLGSDLVGSLRIPAHFCGIYSHKPTPGLIPNESHTPSVPGNKDWLFAMTVGPMARYAEDLALLFDVLVEKSQKYLVDKSIEESDLKVFYSFESGSNTLTSKINPEIRNAMKNAIKCLKDQQIFVEEKMFEKLTDQVDLSFMPLLAIEGLNRAFGYPSVSYFKQFLRLFCCCSQMVLNILLFSWIFSFYRWLSSEKITERNRKLADDLGRDLKEILGDCGVFLYPTFPHPAGFHGQMTSRALDTSYMSIFSVLGFPSTIVPIGLTDKGLPISMQVVSTPNNDKVCLTVARTLEKCFGGWIPPPYAN